MTTEAQPTEIERRLRRAGLPLLVEQPSPSADDSTRAVPLPALVFCGEVLVAIQLDWPWWATVAETWIGHRPASIAGQRALSVELVEVSAVLGAFAGLSYVIAVLNDESYREAFLAGFLASLRETFAQRAEYRRTRG